MEQKLSLEIIDVLLEKAYHARALAEKLKTNHMTVSRRLKDLVDANVLDFHKEGKNKTYFIKRSLEAKNCILMAEIDKLNRILTLYPELRNIVTKIQENPKIELAILFGSYAKGMANKNSDIDIFVETRDNQIKQELEGLNSRLSIKIGDYDSSNLLIKEIEKSHVIIKGVELFYGKRKLFH